MYSFSLKWNGISSFTEWWPLCLARPPYRPVPVCTIRLYTYGDYYRSSLEWTEIVACFQLGPACHLLIPLRWRHNENDSVSNHQPHGCLLNRLFRRRSKKTSKLRDTGLCVGNSPGPVNSPHKGPVTRKMLPFDDVIMRVAIRYRNKINCWRVYTHFFRTRRPTFCISQQYYALSVHIIANELAYLFSHDELMAFVIAQTWKKLHWGFRRLVLIGGGGGSFKCSTVIMTRSSRTTCDDDTNLPLQLPYRLTVLHISRQYHSHALDKISKPVGSCKKICGLTGFREISIRNEFRICFPYCNSRIPHCTSGPCFNIR